MRSPPEDPWIFAPLIFMPSLSREAFFRFPFPNALLSTPWALGAWSGKPSLFFPPPPRAPHRLGFPSPVFPDAQGRGGVFCLSLFSKVLSQGETRLSFCSGGRRGTLSLFFLYLFLSSFSLRGDEGILFFLSVEGVASLRISFFLFLFFSGSGFDLLLRNKSPP